MRSCQWTVENLMVGLKKLRQRKGGSVMRLSQGIIGVLVLGLIFSQTATVAKASALDDLVKAAQKEGALVAQIQASGSGEANKIIRAFLKRFGLKLDMKISWGNESTEFQKAEVAMKMGSAPRFDALFGEDARHLSFINQDLIKNVDNWQEMLREINPLVREGKVKPDQISPAPFTGRSFLFGSRIRVLLYNPTLIAGDQLPNTYVEMGDPKYKGKYAVPPWASTWELGILAYPKDRWLQIVDAAGRNAAAVLYFSRSLGRILGGSLAFAQNNAYPYFRVKAKDPNAPIGLKVLKDATFMLRLLYGVPSRARHPAAGTLFALWMTTDEARLLHRPSYFAENIEVGQTDIDIAERKLIAESGTKLVSWFSNKNAQEKLRWIVSPEGKKYSKKMLRALTQRK